MLKDLVCHKCAVSFFFILWLTGASLIIQAKMRLCVLFDVNSILDTQKRPPNYPGDWDIFTLSTALTNHIFSKNNNIFPKNRYYSRQAMFQMTITCSIFVCELNEARVTNKNDRKASKLLCLTLWFYIVVEQH